MYRKTYVVRSVRMIVDTTEEGGRRILADVLCEEMTSTWMLVHEICKVVDEPSDSDERTALRLLLERFPRDHRKVAVIRWPVKVILRRTELLELHGELTLPNLIVRESL